MIINDSPLLTTMNFPLCFSHDIPEIYRLPGEEYFSEIEKHEVKFQWHGDQDAADAAELWRWRVEFRTGRDTRES